MPLKGRRGRGEQTAGGEDAPTVRDKTVQVFSTFEKVGL
jgi:hypothetical protein